jgi:putative transposase
MENILYQQMEDALWYPQACQFLKIEHHLHSPFEKSIIERTIQYIKDRTENFDIIFLAD